MGLFCANMHFRTTDDKALSAALIRRGVTQFRITPPKNAWIRCTKNRRLSKTTDEPATLAAAFRKSSALPPSHSWFTTAT